MDSFVQDAEKIAEKLKGLELTYNLILNKIGINRFNEIKKKNKYSLNEMLRLYGFHKSYIKNHKVFCIEVNATC